MERANFCSRLAKGILALLVPVVVGGCLVESSTPLTPVIPFPADSPLAGAWARIEQDKTTYLHFGNEGQLDKVIEVEIYRDGRIKNEIFPLSATALGTRHYLNVQLMREGRRHTYVLLKYRLGEEGQLTLWANRRIYVLTPALAAAVFYPRISPWL